MSNDGGRWFEQRKAFRPREGPATDVPELWSRCPRCGDTVFNENLVENQSVCPQCSHHFRLTAMDRLQLLADEGTLVRHDQHLESTDSLGFVDVKPYDQRIREACAKTGEKDAFASCTGRLDGLEVEIGAFDFGYMGGSMGSVVGECICRLFERGVEHLRPCIVVSASGGARMQEGVLSLMQMAKTCAARARLKDVRMPYISVLSHPTTGGVAASFAMLGDVIVAEPRALIGFAGPRVIRETIGEDLPAGFQTAEYLLEHGMLDTIVDRHQLPGLLSQLIHQLLDKEQPPKKVIKS
ncbi:MAG: acetyl-CoA carboxylase carboxyltransferase subunit beta [Proteobacteria bacterium]|nr:acetyl-CoA carboxylase carboxyltransferase subunit beta [Pseudomonadota bacterium]